MVAVKYDFVPAHKLMNSTNLSDEIGKFVFKKPVIYFTILLIVTLLICFFHPHAVIFEDTSSTDLKVKAGLANGPPDFDVELGLQLQLVQPLQQNSNVKTNSVDYAQCSGIAENDRFDCFPQGLVSEATCNQRGCCWAPVNSSRGDLGIPYCYYPPSFGSYKYLNISTSDFGAIAYLQIAINSSYPDNIQLIKISIDYITEDVLIISIQDAKNSRFNTPFPQILKTDRCSVKNTSYTVHLDKEKLGFNIIRKSNNQSIFNTQDVGGFIFADQMLQLSALLPSRRLYGLGQQRNDFLLDVNWRRITLFNHDREPTDKVNLYGSHPFYLNMEDGGLSNGVLLSNSHAMDIILQPAPAITYRVIGGNLDFLVALGPSPAEVLQQYTKFIGRPFMPPYWSLGFHLCRFGYSSLNETVKVWNRTRAAGIPLDTQWNDIDYMDHRNDFTYDKVAFKGLPQFVDLLHKEGMHYIVILDPGVSAGEAPGTYPPYDEGLKLGIFIKDPIEDKPFYTKVWNAKGTVIPDFANPMTKVYWSEQIKKLHDSFAFDGLWIDMNDPSTFWSGGQYGCTPNKLENPPYLPAVEGGKLSYHTLCMSARHYKNMSHYQLHNVFSFLEALYTSSALIDVRDKRPFVISRSSFPGQGAFSGVWTGDIQSTWDDMAHSISDMLSFSLFGIPMSGADICGFNGNTTVALCQRWSQLGAFYPFSRNHNSIESIDQDPEALGPAVVEAARTSLLIRYTLLPYLYTLFWHAHTSGDTVARPMFVQFPHDEKTYTIHSQFLWGAGLLIAPLLSEEKAYATAYLPVGRWYDFYSYRPIDSKGSTFLLNTPEYSIPLLLSGGHILPTQQPETTTTASRKNPIGLIVSLCAAGNASGDLYWDDGDSFDYKMGVYNYMTFSVTGGQLTSTVHQWGYSTTLQLANVHVLGLTKNVTQVLMDGSPAYFTYKPDVKLLNVSKLSVDLKKPFTLSWS